MSALEPKLKPFDVKVLAALPTSRPGVRAREVERLLLPRYGRVPADHGAQIRLVLRGLEHLGRVTGRGGWWRAT